MRLDIHTSSAHLHPTKISVKSGETVTKLVATCTTKLAAILLFIIRPLLDKGLPSSSIGPNFWLHLVSPLKRSANHRRRDLRLVLCHGASTPWLFCLNRV